MKNALGSQSVARISIGGRGGQFCLFILLVVLPFLGVGCAYDKSLRSDVRTEKGVGDEGGSVAEVAGVRITVKGNTWSGEPPNLEEYLTSLQTTLENHSGRSLLIRYNNFILANSSGLYMTALSPQEIKGNVVIGPSLMPFFLFINPNAVSSPGLNFPDVTSPPGEDTATEDPWYYARYYGIWWTPLPTTDMYEKILREGVLENDRHLSGFLYFQKIDKSVSQISFNTKLVDARTEEIFGIVSIPLTLK
jgi:hypothetical protein